MTAGCVTAKGHCGDMNAPAIYQHCHAGSCHCHWIGWAARGEGA